MTDLPEKTISEEFADWTIERVEPVGWAATKYNGPSSHTVAAPTLHELRMMLREVTARASRPRPYAS